MKIPNDSPPQRSGPRLRPRLRAGLVGGSAGVVVALIVLMLSMTTGASDARVTRVSVNPGNAFSAGSLSLVNSRDGGIVISATAMMPGASANGTLTLTTQGNYTAAVTLANGGISDTPSSPALSQALTLLVEDITGTPQTLWSGTMGTFSSVSLGQIASGATRTYRLTVTFPAGSAVAGLQAANTTISLRFTGVAL